MWTGLYSYPNTYFSAAEKDLLNKSPFITNVELSHTLPGCSNLLSASGEAVASRKNFLLENVPNPFSSETSITVQLQHSENISIDILDVWGRPMQRVAAGNLRPGKHTFTWHAQGKARGVYVCRLQAGNHVETRKILLVK